MARHSKSRSGASRSPLSLRQANKILRHHRVTSGPRSTKTSPEVEKAKATIKRSHDLRSRAPRPKVTPTHPGILAVPAGKKVTSMPISHFIKLAKRHGLTPISRALANLERWNRTKNAALSRWAGATKEKLHRAVNNGNGRDKTKLRRRSKAKSKAKSKANYKAKSKAKSRAKKR